MHHDAFDLVEAVALLERTPDTLSALFTGLPDRWVLATEGDGEWSPYDVVGHLIDGERTNWMVRARHILAGESGPFPPFDRTTHLTENQGKNIDELLRAFAELRRENVVALVGMNLTSDDLSRTGLHPEFGEVRLGQLLATWVAHDLNHVRQIIEAMAKEYTEAVGPWIAYLPILGGRE